MSKNEKIQGLWWLSDKPEVQIAGDLSINDRKLELNGSLEGIKSGSFGGTPQIISVEKIKTILGISKNGSKKYTLEFFQQPSFTMSFPGYQSDTYSLGTILEGEHFAQTDNLQFSKYYVEFPYLFEWVNNGVITTQISSLEKKGKHAIEEITIKIGKQKTIEVFKNKKFALSFVIHADKTPVMPSRTMSISQKCVAKITTVNKTLSLVDFYSIVFHLERFLIIAIGKSFEPIVFKAVVNNTSDLINIYPHFLKEKEYKSVHPADMNFTFLDIKNESQTIFEKWFSNQEKHKDAFNLFSVINSDTAKNLNNQFKDIVSTIEGYVRVEKNDLNVSLDKAVKTLNEVIPENDRPLTSNDYKKIRITRNKLSHVTIKQDDEKFILNDKEKWENFHKLLFILEYSFLKNLGMSESLLGNFYKKKKIWT